VLLSYPGAAVFFGIPLKRVAKLYKVDIDNFYRFWDPRSCYKEEVEINLNRGRWLLRKPIPINLPHK
jgi:hypothetical protein